MSRSSDLAVRLSDVSKSYIVYAKPRYWLADFLGLGSLLKEGRHYRSFWALRDINLEVPRGAKLAIVGRNGAGKSTLLRIISENIAPTTGTVEVHGRCEALMQLGTGFNPEFTGRECAYTSLAYMGITGAAADERLWDILDFSELDEFMDQPVRTYSSGMYLRLAFSVATAIAPDILIIDEILGAGDLYFQSKCLSRVEALTSGPGTTVLFVSHDLGAAQRLCDNFIWIDRGRIVARGPAADIRALYEDSIRKQQERRLQARNLRLSPHTAAALEARGDDGFHMLGQLVLEAGDSEPAGPHVEAIRLYTRGELAEELRIGDAMDDNSRDYPSFIVSDPGSSRWGSPVRRGQKLTRAVMPEDGGVKGAAFALSMTHDTVTDPDCRLEIEVAYQDSSRRPCHLELNAGSAGLKRILSLEHAADQEWKSTRASIPRWVYAAPAAEARAATREPRETALPQGAEAREPGVAVEKRFGTGQVVIEQVSFLNDQGKPSYFFANGRSMSIVLSYETRDASLVGSRLLWAVGLERMDGVMAATMISSVQGCVFELEPHGRLRLTLEPLLLTQGHYRVSVVLFSNLDLDGFSPHFTRSPEVYDMHRLAYEVVVEGTYPMEIGLFRQPVRWESLASPAEK